MAQAKLRRKLEESKLEIQRLRERMSLEAPTIHKYFSLISLIPRWSASESTNSLEEFISTFEASARIGRREPKDTPENIESQAKIGRWHPSDCLNLEVSEVADPASSRINLCPKFHGKKYDGRNSKRRLEIVLKPHSGVTGARA